MAIVVCKYQHEEQNHRVSCHTKCMSCLKFGKNRTQIEPLDESK